MRVWMLHFKRKALATLSCAMLLLVGCQTTSTPTATIPPVHVEIGSSAIGISEIWRDELGYPTTIAPPQPFLFANDRLVIFPSQVNPNNPSDANEQGLLNGLSLNTGKLLWQTPFKDLNNSGVDSAFLDSKQLYLVYDNAVHAFDLQTGHWLWDSSDFGGHTSYNFRPWDPPNPLQLHDSSNKLITIDPNTGALIERVPDGALLSYGSVDFLTSRQSLSAVDNNTGQVLWERDQNLTDKSQMHLWPAFVGNDVIYLSGIVASRIIRINIKSGQTIWQTDSIFVSNFALDDENRLYALSQDGSLVVMDSGTGAVIDTVLLLGWKPDPHTKNYDVVISGSYLMLGFSDIPDLITLKLPSVN